MYDQALQKNHIHEVLDDRTQSRSMDTVGYLVVSPAEERIFGERLEALFFISVTFNNGNTHPSSKRVALDVDCRG